MRDSWASHSQARVHVEGAAQPPDCGNVVKMDSRSGLARRRKSTDRPRFHVMPRSGWMNDPNGPIFFEGYYHLFYQQVVTGVTWDYGIVWGHSISPDLVNWEDLPPALVPTPGGPDANGCFSGCCILDPDTGLPTILYTGVRLRANEECGPLPPEDCDLRLEFIETQCMAVAVPGDLKLEKWTKRAAPVLDHPPAGMNLTGWRDPFILESGKASKEWTMLIGSGIHGAGGAVLKYKSDRLNAGWIYNGILCMGDGNATGAMWECPILAEISPHPIKSALQYHSRTHVGTHPHPQDCDPLNHGSRGVPMSSGFENKLYSSREPSWEQRKHFFCVSPDEPINPVLYWLGDTVNETFLIEGAHGPYRLDIGDVLYAPNTTRDPQGRLLLWGWLRELPSAGEQDYAGCLSVPRLLHLHNGRLFQEPAPEIMQLRTEKLWHEIGGLHLFPEESTPLECVGGAALDIELTFERGSSLAAGLILRSWAVDGSGTCVILFDWEQSVLEVTKSSLLQDMSSYTDVRIGGALDLKPGDPLELRILLDNSCLEIFTGTGEVLTTRVYRGQPPAGADAGIDLIAQGGVARLARVEAYEMRSIWNNSSSSAGGSNSSGALTDPLC